MKIRNYENTNLIFSITILVLIIEIIVIILISLNKDYTYKKVVGLVVKKDIVMIIMSKEEREILNKNSYIYVDSLKKKYKIREIRKDVITKNKKKYSEVLIEYKFNKKLKANDVIDIVIKDNKKMIIELFKQLWDGD